MKDFVPKSGDFFVDLSENYSTVAMLQCFANASDNNRLYAAGHQGKDEHRKMIRKPLDDLSGPFFPSFILRRDVSGLEDKRDVYKRIRKEIEEFLIKRDNYSATISEIISLLTSKGEIQESIEIIIKVLIVEALEYRYKKLQAGEYLTYADLKSNAEKSKQYYGSLAEEIKIKSDKISLLVSHDQTTGNYRELILRELLKKYVPAKFAVATGFIEDVAKQLDIIIYDAQNYYPTFKEGDLVVVRPEAVRAIIEVKSDLNATTLHESLESFYDILRPGLFKPDIPLFKGIFAFNTDYVNSKSIATNIREFYNDPYFVKSLQQNMTRDIMYLYHEITCVTVLRKHCLFTKYLRATDDPSSCIIPQVLSISDERGIDIQTTMFLALLFDYLDVDYYSKRTITQAFSKLYSSHTANIKLEEKLTSDDWKPSTRSKNEHDGTQSSIEARLDKIDDWFNGEITTTDYLKEWYKD